MSEDKSVDNKEGNVEEQQRFELPNQEEKRETEEDSIDLTDALPEEVKLAEEVGLTPKEEEEDGEHAEHSEPETSKDKEVETKEDEKEVEETPTFDDVEQDEKLLDKYDSNAKAFYWKWKNDKHKRQEAQKELEELKANTDLDTLKQNVYGKKLDAIKVALADPDLTVEKLQAIIDSQQPAEDKSAPLTKADLEDIKLKEAKEEELKEKQTREFATRVLTTEKIGKAKYDNFDDIVKLAQDVVDNDKSGTYQEVLANAFSDENINEEALMERVINIAKLSPQYGELGKSVKAEDKNKVDRAIKNSKKKVSSAAVGTSGSKRIVNEDELTPDDASQMSTTQWIKLKPETQKRLLGG